MKDAERTGGQLDELRILAVILSSATPLSNG